VAAGAPEGPGTSQVREASRGIGRSQPKNKPQTRQSCKNLHRTKFEIRSFGVLRSAPVRGLLQGSRGRFAAVLPVVAALVVATPAGSGADPSSATAEQLRVDTSVLESRTHRALLDLYSLETQLGAARSRLDGVRREASHVRTQQALARRQVAIAQRALTVSQRRLAARLKLLYEQGQPDPVAVILGSTSLDDAITSLDALNRSARQSRNVIDQTTASRRALRRLSARLDAHRTELAALERQAEANAAALAAARADRAALVVSLRAKEQLNRSTIASLEATAEAAQVKSETLSVVGSAAGSAASVGTPAPTSFETSNEVAAVPAAEPAPVAGVRTITVSTTGYSLAGRTATGIPAGWGVVAVDPSVIALGTHLTVPGYGEAVAADTGGAVRGAMIDLWFPTLVQARAWGRRTVTITLH
jgi:3D (Asp-Asp-Asp) domain-containing protein